MATQEEELALKEWLTRVNFANVFDKLRECGVGSLDDLKILTTEAEVRELAGPGGINLGVVFRRKFINAVLTLQDITSPPGGAPGGSATTSVDSPGGLLLPQQRAEYKDEEPDDEEPVPPSQPMAKRKSVQMNMAEDQALARLRATIRSHTQSLKLLKENMPLLHQQAREIRAQIQQEFDDRMKDIARRKKQLDDTLNLAESETTTNLNQKIGDLATSARQLLGAKRDVETRLAEAVDDEQRRERSGFVVQTISDALREVPKEENAQYQLVFDTQDVNLNEIIVSYGQIYVSRRKNGSDGVED